MNGNVIFDLMRLKIYSVILVVLGSAVAVSAQINAPVIKANSSQVAIRDGNEGKTKFWNHLIKSSKPIKYHLAKNQSVRRVVFYTDMDSIVFQVAPESDYNFRVALHKSDTCHVTLTTKNYWVFNRFNRSNETDTLPFTLNESRQIIIEGSLNNCVPINFCFDLGARTAYLIGKGLDKSNNLNLDGLLEDESVTGLSTEKSSSINTLQLGSLQIEDMPVCYIDETGFLGNGGGLIGFNLFEGKIIEIDFDKQQLLVHCKLPTKINGYAELPFKQTSGGIYLPVKTKVNSIENTGWYFFDTGADHALSIDAKYSEKQSLSKSLKVLGKVGLASSESKVIKALVVEMPEVVISGYKIENVPVLLPEESNAEAQFEEGVIGIGLLSKFNLVIDFPKNTMYLKPNKYFSDSFKKKDDTNNYLTLLLSAIFISIAAFFIWKKWK
ncbi:MAG: retropepsin-like domain-containing protein [Bacteroidia bacterium]|nr:retropepsin-like domain-containing protein [Bacteroidia bacterium]